MAGAVSVGDLGNVVASLAKAPDCYSKSGSRRRWTVAELKSVGVRWLGAQLSDGDGWVGTVRSGDGGALTIHWCQALEREGRVALHCRRTWPLATLESIRQARDDAREAIKRGADPNATRVADRIEVRERIKTTLAADALRKAGDASVEDDARERLEAGVARKDGNVLLKRSLEKKVFPRIGAQPCARAAALARPAVGGRRPRRQPRRRVPVARPAADVRLGREASAVAPAGA
jgi:hypothetical protein